MSPLECPLCHANAEKVLFCSDKFRIIQVADPLYPAYYRLIWGEHVKEMSDLSQEDQMLILRALMLMEKTMIAELKHEKINWAQFGNMVPHVHWHLIARWKDDAAFPDNSWCPAKRETAPEVLEARQKAADLCGEVIAEKFLTEF